MLFRSKTPCPGRVDPGRELRNLRAVLEAEKSRNQQARQRFSLDLRRLREEAEREQQRALQELTARHERQKALELVRLRHELSKEQAGQVRSLLRYRSQELRASGAGPEREHEAALREAGGLRSGGGDARGSWGHVGGRERRGKTPKGGGTACLGGVETSRKLEHLLLQLHEAADGEQALSLQTVSQELGLEKGLVPSHLQEAHGLLKVGEQRPRSPSRRSKSCAHLFHSPDPHRFPPGRSRSLSQSSKSASPPPNKRSRGERWNLLSARDLAAAARCSSPLTGDTCRSSPLEGCPPQTSPYADWDPQSSPRSRPKSPGSDQSSCSPCFHTKMDHMVSCLCIFDPRIGPQCMPE